MMIRVDSMMVVVAVNNVGRSGSGDDISHSDLTIDLSNRVHISYLHIHKVMGINRRQA